MADLSLNNLLWERRIRRYRGRKGDVDSQLEGFRLFCLEQVKIEHPSRGRVPFELRDAQLETARAYIEQAQTIVLKARQIGFTTLTMEFCLWSALFHPGWSAIILSRREQDAKDALRKAAEAYDDLEDDLRTRLPKRTNSNSTNLSFDNRSYIESHPSANNPARGRSASFMVLDELAFMPDSEEAWKSVKPVTDVGGRIAALSTAHGYGNLFHQLWVGARKGDNNFYSIFYPWSAIPERNQDWYEAQKRDMSPQALAQEYPSNEDEAFLKSGNPVFDVDILRDIETQSPLRGNMVEIQDGPVKWAFREYATGPLSVYQKPVSDHSYVVGADTAEGLVRGDFSSAHVIDVQSGDVVAHWHGKADPDLFGIALGLLGRWYRTALIGVESNMHGGTVLRALQQTAKYPRIYTQRNVNNRRESMSERLGWYTSKTSKPRIIDGLGTALRECSISLVDAPTVEELCQYVTKDDGSTSGSPHDDRVMSLAIAVEMMRWAFSPEQKTKAEGPEWGTWDYIVREMNHKAKKNEPWVLGRSNMRQARSHA
ncbi:MAG: terminase family protein [Parafilimonas sp.]